MSELLIKINADVKNAKAAFDDIKDQSKDLESTLSDVAKVSAVAFAAFTAEIGFAVAAFKATEDSTRKLTASLQAQGIFTTELRDEYEALATELEEKLGIDDAVIRNSTALIQSYIGQEKVTKDLIQATADFATLTGQDLNGASQLVAKTIGTSTNALARYGIQIDANATKAEKLALVTQGLKAIADGQTEAQLRGLGALNRLTVAFGNIQEEIGKRFAPAVTAGANALANLFNFINKSPAIIALASGFLAAGVAVTALGTALPLLAQGFLTVRAALLALNVSLTATQIAVRGLLLASGIGALVAVATFVLANWSTIWPQATAIFQAFANNIGTLAGGLKEVILGALTLDGSRLQAGLDQVKNAYGKAADEIAASFKKISEANQQETEKQNEAQKALADKKAALERQELARKQATLKAENELVLAELNNQSQAVIDLKKREVEILKQLETEKNANRRELLNRQLEENREFQTQQQAEDIERAQIFAEEKRAVDAELRAQDIATTDVLRQEEIAKVQAQAQTEKDIETKIAQETLQERIKNRNLELEDRKRYGAAVATINSALRSTEVQNAKAVSDELVALTQSKNNTLKSIGKAAAIANITIATAESAVTIAQKVIAALPFPINIPIAAGLAAARVAFGAEQIATVRGAQSGALVEGPGRGDTVPFMLEPGELVAPRKNFEEVVTGVNLVRNGGADQSGVLEALGRIEDKISGGNTIVVQGDVLAEDSFMDNLAKKLSDAIEFRNAKIFGVNV